jgi:hypothetical protein
MIVAGLIIVLVNASPNSGARYLGLGVALAGLGAGLRIEAAIRAAGRQ